MARKLGSHGKTTAAKSDRQDFNRQLGCYQVSARLLSWWVFRLVPGLVRPVQQLVKQIVKQLVRQPFVINFLPPMATFVDASKHNRMVVGLTDFSVAGSIVIEPRNVDRELHETLSGRLPGRLGWPVIRCVMLLIAHRATDKKTYLNR